MTKRILWIVVAVVVVAGGAWYFWPDTASTPDAVAPTPTPSVSKMPKLSPSPANSGSVATPTPTVTVTVSPTPSQSPGIIFRESQIFTVTMSNNAFQPSPLTVHRGDVVIFENTSSFTQTVTALNKVFDSDNIRPGDQWGLTTGNLTPATYTYESTTHPIMRGTLIVLE